MYFPIRHFKGAVQAARRKMLSVDVLMANASSLTLQITLRNDVGEAVTQHAALFGEEGKVELRSDVLSKRSFIARTCPEGNAVLNDVLLRSKRTMTAIQQAADMVVVDSIGP